MSTEILYRHTGLNGQTEQAFDRLYSEINDMIGKGFDYIDTLHLLSLKGEPSETIIFMRKPETGILPDSTDPLFTRATVDIPYETDERIKERLRLIEADINALEKKGYTYVDCSAIKGDKGNTLIVNMSKR